MNLYQSLFIQDDHSAASRILFQDASSEYSQYDFQIRLQHLISELAIHSEKKWVIATESRLFFSLALFALLLTGKTPILLGHNLPKRLVSQASLFEGILVETPIQSLLPSKACINLAELFQTYKLPAKVAPFPQLLLSEAAFFQKISFFTSGSTSEPTEVIKTLALLEKESELLIRTFSRSFQPATFLSTVSPLHQYGVTFNILLPLALQQPIYLHTITYQEELAKFTDSTPYILISSPAFLKRLDQNIQTKCRFNKIFSAGGALSDTAAIETQYCFGTAPTEIYGSSETGVIAHKKHPAPLGLFTPFSDISIAQAEDETIRVSSPLIENSPFSLSDKIDLTVEQSFKIIGRSDRVIKIEEKRISLTEIENLIQDLLSEKCVKCHVIPLQQGSRTILGAIIIMPPSIFLQSKDAREIIMNLKGAIEPVAIPKKWRFIHEAPEMNSQGKITLHSLKALFND